jgi:hypothetical protein
MSVSDKDVPIYDWAVNSGSRLKIHRTDKSTIANILEQFQSVADPKEAALLTMMYIKRQAGRREIDRFDGNMLIERLGEIYNKYFNEPEKLKENILKFLTLVKWAYESDFDREIKDFNDFMNYIRKKG